MTSRLAAIVASVLFAACSVATLPTAAARPVFPAMGDPKPTKLEKLQKQRDEVVRQVAALTEQAKAAVEKAGVSLETAKAKVVEFNNAKRDAKSQSDRCEALRSTISSQELSRRNGLDLSQAISLNKSTLRLEESRLVDANARVDGLRPGVAPYLEQVNKLVEAEKNLQELDKRIQKATRKK